MLKKTGFAIAAVMVLTLAGCSFGKQNIEIDPKAGAKIGAPVREDEAVPCPSDVTVHMETIEIEGLTEEHEIVFTADNHISLWDERDSLVANKAKERYETFKSWDGAYADESFKSVIQYVRSENPELLVIGGDLLDSAMYAGIDFASGQLSTIKVPYLYGMGNHDFEYDNEYFSDRAFKEYLPRLSALSGIDKGYRTAQFDEYIVLIADDYGNKVSPDALEELIRINKLGKPIIVSVHVPIEPGIGNSLWEMSKQVWGQTSDGTSKVLLGNRSIIPNDVTTAFLDEMRKNESNVKVVLAGHVHFYHKDMLNDNIIQLVAGPGYNKEVTKIILKPKEN